MRGGQQQGQQQTTALLFLMAKHYKPRGLDWAGKRKTKADIKINKNKLAGKCLVCGNMLPTSPHSARPAPRNNLKVGCRMSPSAYRRTVLYPPRASPELPLSYFIISPSHDKKFLAKQLKGPTTGVRLASQPHTVHVRSPKKYPKTSTANNELLLHITYYTERLPGGSGSGPTNNAQHMYAKKKKTGGMESGKFATRSTEPKLVWGAAKVCARLSF